MTAIIAAAAELGRGESGDEVLRELIASEASKLERYISNLLDMARIEAGAVKLKVEPVDLVDSVSAALKDVGTSLEHRRVEVELSSNLPLVKADPQLLHHCLINLLDNAGRYSAPGSAITIRGSTERGDVLLSIENEGADPTLAGGAILDAFTSISGSDRKGGTGLGLAIVKAFAEAMGADVVASSRSNGEGAVFMIRFPEQLALRAINAADAE